MTKNLAGNEHISGDLKGTCQYYGSLTGTAPVCTGKSDQQRWR